MKVKTSPANITVLLGQLKAAVIAAQLSINERFAALKEEGEKLKLADASITLPWNTYTPPEDQRRYQVENCMDAVLKVLPTEPLCAITTPEIIKRIQGLHLSYSEASIRCALSSIVLRQYSDREGFTLAKKNSGTLQPGYKLGRPRLLLWKVRA